MNGYLSTIVLLLGLVACPAFAAAPDAAPADAWPVARGTPGGCGVAGGALPEKLELAWTFTAEKRGFVAGAVIAGGKVFAGSVSGMLYAIDLNSGAKLWQYDSGSQIRTSPAFREGRVYIGDLDDTFHCVDAASGKLLWKHATDDQISRRQPSIAIAYSSAATTRRRIAWMPPAAGSCGSSAWTTTCAACPRWPAIAAILPGAAGNFT